MDKINVKEGIEVYNFYNKLIDKENNSSDYHIPMKSIYNINKYWLEPIVYTKEVEDNSDKTKKINFLDNSENLYKILVNKDKIEDLKFCLDWQKRN